MKRLLFAALAIVATAGAALAQDTMHRIPWTAHVLSGVTNQLVKPPSNVPRWSIFLTGTTDTTIVWFRYSATDSVKAWFPEPAAGQSIAINYPAGPIITPSRGVRVVKTSAGEVWFFGVRD